MLNPPLLNPPLANSRSFAVLDTCSDEIPSAARNISCVMYMSEVQKYLHGDLAIISPTVISEIALNIKQNIEFHPSGRIFAEQIYIS